MSAPAPPALLRIAAAAALVAAAGAARAQSLEDRTWFGFSAAPSVTSAGSGTMTRLELATGAPPIRLGESTRWLHSFALRRYGFGATGAPLEVERALYDVRYGTSVAQRLGAR